MAWIRLDDDYIYHPKFEALSHGAFRLWHEGLRYCRKLMTDGLIPRAALKTFRYAKAVWIAELTAPPPNTKAALWEPDAQGYRMHDYLDWNQTAETETHERDAAKLRMRAHRGRLRRSDVTPPVTANVTPPVTPPVLGQGQVLQEIRNEKTRADFPKPARPHPISAEFDAPEELTDRAGRLLERYAELFYQHRRGARYHNRMHLDFPKACELVTTWTDDARLEKLAVLVLTTDDDWIARTDRGFGIFAARASWADDKLRAWELENGVSA